MSSPSENGRPSARETPGPRTDLMSPDPADRTRAEPIFQGDVDTDNTVVVCGAGGFIGGHLVADLLRQGYSAVRAVDIKPPNQWFQKFPQADNRSLDLREKESCYRALENADHVYNLAADMGGMGVIERDCVERGALNVAHASCRQGVAAAPQFDPVPGHGRRRRPRP